MRNPLFLIIIVVLGTILTSCGSYNAGGGAGGANYQEKTTTTAPDGTITVTEKTAVATIQQPENPNESGSLVFTDPNGGQIKLGTGKSDNSIVKAKQTNDLLKIVIGLGAALILGGVAVGILLKQVKWAIAMGLVGAGMIAGSFLLAQYSMVFLCLFVVGVVMLLGYGAFLIYKQFISHKANVENVALIQAIKPKLSDEAFAEVFTGDKETAPLVKSIQSPSTSKIVEKIKYDEKI